MKLNLSRIFTREEPIAGLEVGESELRLSLLESDGKTGAVRAAFSVSEPVPSGTIRAGAIADPKKFSAALQNIVKKAPSKVRYAIISIPADPVYSKIFSFPKTIQGQKLEEAVKLVIGFQLPLKVADAYIDWERIETREDSTDVFLAAIPKAVANAYIEAMEPAGLNPVAIEFQPLSLARIVEPEPGTSMMIKSQGASSGVICVVKNGSLRFSRVIPFDFADKAAFENEARKVKDFYEAEYGPIGKEMTLAEAKAGKDDGLFGHVTGEKGLWFTSFGAARRGLLPRSEDKLISLMPVSTEQAYEYHKAIIFSEFISNLTIGISVFFAAAFLFAWIALLSFQTKTRQELQNANSLPVPADASELEAKAQNVNDLAGAGAQALQNISPWSAALVGIKQLVVPGVIVKDFSMPDIAATITMDGTANSRDILNAFRRALSSSTLISGISFPPTDLNQTANIPFSVSFKLNQS